MCKRSSGWQPDIFIKLHLQLYNKYNYKNAKCYY